MKTVIYNNIKGIVKGILPSCLFVFLPLTAAAQDMKKVSGYVMDAATGKPLAGVIVEAYGNHRYTAMTDETGAYELKVPDYVSSVSMRVEGYQVLQKAIRTNTEKTNAELYPNTFSPIYERTTTSGSTRRAENFEHTAQVSIDPLVAEQLGADIHSVGRSGQLGIGNTMFINGLTSLQTNAQPLVVIDGVITDIGKVAGDFFRTLLGLTCFRLLRLDMNRSINIFLDQLFVEQDSVFVVIAFPGHETDQRIAAQTDFTHFRAGTIGEEVTLLNLLAGTDNGTLVDAGALVGTGKLA